MPVLKIRTEEGWELICGSASQANQNNIYSQNDEPLGAPDGSLWVDLDADSSVSPDEVYTKSEIDAIMGSYINDIDNLIGGDA